jgi:hypothetical protein
VSPQRRRYVRYAMVLRRRLIVQIALLGGLILAFPSTGSALCAIFVRLTPNGPSPAVLTIGPGGPYPVWTNNDQVTHTVTFANGLCSLQLAPGAYGQCDFPLLVGQYPYTVDGVTQASVVVNALPPSIVTLAARGHRLPRAANLRLHGTLTWSTSCGPPIVGPLRVPIVVLARHDRYHPFRRIATVRSETRTPYDVYTWQLELHPKAKAIYIAKLTYQPLGEQGSRTSWSRPFKVRVRR